MTIVKKKKRNTKYFVKKCFNAPENLQLVLTNSLGLKNQSVTQPDILKLNYALEFSRRIRGSGARHAISQNAKTLVS